MTHLTVPQAHSEMKMVAGHKQDEEIEQEYHIDGAQESSLLPSNTYKL